MTIIEGVNKLAENYENALIEHTETSTNATEYELKLKESAEKVKRLAVTVRKLQNIRTKLQQNLETMKQKLMQTTTKSDQYHKSLTSIHTETQRSLEKWKKFINEGQEMEGNTDMNANSCAKEADAQENDLSENDEQYLKRCLGDVRSLTMYFIQILDMYREKTEQHQGDTSELEKNLALANEKIVKYEQELKENQKHIENRESTQIAKNAMIEKLTQKLNHSIQCDKDNWHHDVTKADFVDLSVSTRLVLGDIIWCLIRWRHKIPNIPSMDAKEDESVKKKKYNDEYFWSTQTMFLQKLNVKENEIYLPDFFENKLESQITKNLESKWKAIQRRTDRTIQELVCFFFLFFFFSAYIF